MWDKIIKLFLLIPIFILCSKKEMPEEISVVNISNTRGSSESPAIAADSRGYFYVVWEDRAPNGILCIYITQRPPGGNWTQPEYILEPQTPQRQPDIVVDKENTLHVVGQYTNPQGWGEILYTQKPLNGSWTNPVILGMHGMACIPKIAVDNYGNVHIVWQELVGYWPIFYARKTKDGFWSTPIEISKELGDDSYTMAPAITVDQSGYAHVVWTQSINCSSYLEDALVYTTNAPSGTWSDPIAICHDSLLQIGLSPQIVVDDNHTDYVVWKMRKDIFYTFKPLNGQWSTVARVCSTATISMWPQLAAEHDGCLHLV